MRALLQSFDKTNRRYRLLQKNDAVVLGLSGGPDSVALFFLLLRLRKKYGLRLYAAHLSHNLSVKDSLKFKKFSERLARRFHIPFIFKNVNLRQLARKNKTTLEETGRIERYRFFSEVARKVRANKIATAHTLDDQAETILMRVARGAGLKGLAGIPVIRKEGRFEIIRPLAGISKKEILQFLKKFREPFCVDPSNRENIFTRNRVRHTLIPWIEKNLNPRIRESLSDLGSICAEADNLIGDLAAGTLKSCVLKKSGPGIRLNLLKLRRQHPAVRSEALFQALVLFKGNRLRFGSAHLESIQAILDSPEERLQIHLPGAVTAAKEKGVLRIFDTPRK